ncbi:MAG: DNA gyrase subunit A [Gemmatimonadaceae bacterium]
MTAPNNRERILPRLIDDEIKESFINYSMSVIVSRALPDVRDGLKPVHRRVLYSMLRTGLIPGRPYKKCATVVGDVLGKYHPHGDSSVYDALVRMVQDFSLRYPLIDGQGNFGSVEGDPPAAYRYTESRLMAIAIELLADIDKETVNFVPNFDEQDEEPSVLPSGIPNLVVNGSSGIAVGMATNIPPHNLKEVVSALVKMLDEPDTSATEAFKSLTSNGEIRKLIKGPDFPTGGYIYGRAGISDYQETGRGRIVMRARAVIEEKESSNKSQIVVTEIPYQVNSAKLIENIADLVRDKKLEGISDLRNESDKDGMRIVIELKRDAIPRVVLNQLYKHTAMQSTFGVIMLALVPDARTGQLVPKVMPLKEVLEHYITHRHEVIVRRTEYDLKKAVEREHILEGLKIAVDNIDAVVKIIRGADDTPSARAELMSTFALSERQAQAILDMQLARLTGLAIEKLEAELAEVRAEIKGWRALLASKDARMKVLKDELLDVMKKYGDERRSEIISDEGEFTIEDLIAEEEMVITISHSGYIKRTSASTYKKQRRGGRGNNGATLKDEDFVEHLFVASTHDYVLVFTDDGRCFWLKVHEIPQAGRAAKGKPIVNMINVSPDTQVSAIVTVRDFPDDQFLLFSTKQGTVKKTALSQYSNPRPSGIKAIKIEETDELIDVQVTTGTSDIVLATRHGLSIRFHEQDVRQMGRDTTGVKGIQLGPRDELIGMVVIKREANLLVVTEKGMGKCSPIDDYRVQKRGGKGIITVHRTDKTGDAVSIKEVLPDDELMLITKQGIAIRMPVKGIRVAGRNTQGVRMVNLEPNDLVMDVARVVPDDEADTGDDTETGDAETGGDDE